MAELAMSDFINALHQALANIIAKPPNPLHSDQVDAIQRCTVLVNSPVSTKNTPKRRAKRILSDLWKYNPQLFVLCSLAMYPSRIGMLKSTNYLEAMVEWLKQNNITIPIKELSRIVDDYPHLLPDTVAPASSLESSVPISPSEMLEFFKEHFGMIGVALERHTARLPEMDLSLPYAASALPYIRINQHVKLELSWKAASTLIARSQPVGLA
ncbi:hypothetical protein GGR50DRAFT_97704 [Xylaria sp. CBS 124048]|nr:hypothetical protein GGR50DRAFT_97704 [Xylaria sp. CBS 124048]